MSERGSERARIKAFSDAVDIADPNMDHHADNPITYEEVESALASFPHGITLTGQIIHFINTRPADPFANL